MRQMLRRAHRQVKNAFVEALESDILLRRTNWETTSASASDIFRHAYFSSENIKSSEYVVHAY